MVLVLGASPSGHASCKEPNSTVTVAAAPNVLSARAEGLTPQALVDRNTGWFAGLCDALDSSHDAFIRTTSRRHHESVRWFWGRLDPGDLYQRAYTGLYCDGCEDFYLERDLPDGVCPDHGTAPVPVREENWFFRLSAYQERVEQLIRSDAIRIVPEARKNEVLGFIRGGLDDISVSRSSNRSDGWGIPLPGEILVHGFLTENGRKISKSRGFSVDPVDCVRRYGVDPVRYYLLRAIRTTGDGDFSEARIRDLYETDLANGLGNASTHD